MKLFSKYKVQLSPEEKKQRRKERLLLILSGIILGISFPPFPFPFTLLIFVGLIPYFIVIKRRTTLASISSATFLFSLVFSLITIYWVGSWSSEADPYLMLAGVALLLVYPCVMLIPSTLFYLTRKVFPKFDAIWFFPLFWVTLEYLLTQTDLRFPWLLLGHGLAKFNLFIQGADIVGTNGLSLIAAYLNVLLFKSFFEKNSERKFRLKPLLIAVFIFLCMIIYGIYKTSTFRISERKVRIGIVQPNLNPWDKWSTGNLSDLLNMYLTLSQKCVDEGAEVILWPETALPVYAFGGTYPMVENSIYNFLDTNHVSLLTGMPDIIYDLNQNNIPEDSKYSGPGNYYYRTYNAVLGLNPGSRNIQRYGKMKLVPLGERVPFVDQFAFLGDLLKWGVGITGWNIGKDTTVFKIKNEKIDTIKVGGLVCYESVDPVFVTAFVQKGAELITVVTNDSWYGKSSGPYQHKDFAMLRAVENRRSVVRCANGGVSCIINAKGNILAETKMFVKTTLVGEVPLQDEKTFYSENPLIVPILCSVFSFWIFGMNILIWLKSKFKM
ncbi:MAG: apolipoprotein N-acyltransferase [Ignavibacteriota bacterium]|nr:MAG: apolipoprotein N-acyltransferase [Chlorobiota bacterium]MBE7476825.1 apolipoprotein N-acyltransferase [Ignavibacteriales bacterium]MBL1121923.1 apolipoprotein N-acyltransferase [Ignavibacteriota bacterium]MCC7095152.1 apolipoprotein N-acyltransferase [Ignavibacteriaceae bacterium]MCE7855582.1 apolipoprotein N-acyltransferase [Ignavibacteria bacterium CHB3]MEB2295997.1 apolipoprotein N-acyltransferase [Ignavibacteria bacterium]